MLSSAVRPLAFLARPLILAVVAAAALSQAAAPALAAPTAPSSEAAASQALTAGWLARQTEAYGGALPSAYAAGETDYTNTAYAIFSLAAAGVGRDAIGLAADTLLDSGEAYIGAPEALPDKWSAVALTALALAVAGRNPSSFPAAAGPRDLFAEVASQVGPDGQIGAAPSAYTAALAVLALARSADGVPPALADWLEAQPCADAASDNYGGFGFTPMDCASGDADSTALAIQALLAAGRSPDAPVLAAAKVWLETQQDPSGGWGTPGFSPVNANTTGLASQALRALGSSAPAAAEAFLLSLTLGCDEVTADGPTDNIGAMAYAAADGKPDPGATKTEAVAVFLGASVQGLLGLGGGPLGELDGTQASADVPSGAPCLADQLPSAPGTDAPLIAAPPAANTGVSVGWWIGGGIALLLLAGGVAGAVLARRK
ncbi:MAG: hypothetical protein LBI84_04250 [Propionibacteriaceae bacterium]|nr:hypothetical protein [Propionibacteriaceae bacterium]